MKKGQRKNPPQKTINFEALDQQTKELFSEVFEEYDNLSIFKLREVARKMGVKSATTMDKQTLVTATTELRLSSTVYCPPEQKAVAPVSYKEVEDLTNDYLMRSLVISPEKKVGILEICSDGAWLRTEGFQPSVSDIFVPMLMVNELDLKTGDEVSGQARFLDKCGRYGLFKAELINGQNADLFARKQLSEPVPAKELLRLGKGSRAFNVLNIAAPLCKGQRKLMIGIDAYKIDGIAREYSTKLSALGFKTINIFLDENPETMRESVALAGQNLVLACEDYKIYDSAVSLAVEYAKAIAPYGNDVAIILNNADVLEEKTLRAVFGAGRNTDFGSITPIIISSSLELNPVINRLSRTANAITLVKSNFSDEPMIDVRRSFSECEKMLDKFELAALRDCRSRLGEQFVSVKEFMSVYEEILSGEMGIKISY